EGSAHPQKGSSFWSWLGGLLILALVVALGLAYIVHNPSGDIVPWIGNTPPTATPTGFARRATIAFVRLTQKIAAPSATLVAATDGSGQIPATVQNASVTGAASAPIPAPYQRAQQVTFAITVSNPTSGDITSGAGITIRSTDGSVTCSVYPGVDVPAH